MEFRTQIADPGSRVTNPLKAKVTNVLLPIYVFQTEVASYGTMAKASMPTKISDLTNPVR